MEWYEIKALMKYDHYSYKDSWEQARLIAYLIAQTNSTRKLRLLDIVKFHWDNDESAPDTSISQEDVERLREKAKQYENLIK